MLTAVAFGLLIIIILITNCKQKFTFFGQIFLHTSGQFHLYTVTQDQSKDQEDLGEFNITNRYRLKI